MVRRPLRQMMKFTLALLALVGAADLAQAQELRISGGSGPFTTNTLAAFASLSDVSKVYRVCATGGAIATGTCAGAAAIGGKGVLQDWVVIEGTLKNCGATCNTVNLGRNGGGPVRIFVAAGGAGPALAAYVVLGGVVGLLAVWLRSGREVSGADARLLGLLGLGVLGNHLLILMGLNYVSGAVGGVIIGSSPVVTSVLSAMLIRDVPLRAVWGGAVLSFAGVGVVSVAGFQAAGDQPLLGSALVFLGVVSWALYSIGSRTIMERLSALTVNWTTLMVATVLHRAFRFPVPGAMQELLTREPEDLPEWDRLRTAIVTSSAGWLRSPCWRLIAASGAGSCRI